MVQISKILGVVALSSAFLGCAEPERHEERLTVDELAETLAIDIGAGDVRVTGANVTQTQVSARIEGPSNHLGHEVLGGRLTLFDECNEQPCSVDVTVTVPRSAALDLHLDSGDVALQHLRGAILLSTGSGDVRGLDLAGLDLSAELGSGDLRFDVTESANRVQVRTGSGDLELTVPSGSYRLDVSTGSGDQKLAGVSDDSNAAGAIEARTDSGDLRLIGR